jgi:hypothetical protein
MGEQFDTFIVATDREFSPHFQGFKSLKCVSYVTSLHWLLEFLEKNTFESIEIIIGKEASDLKPEDILKEELRKDDVEMVNKILELTRDNKLRIYIANRIIHSKFYILEGDKSIRAIQGSANLTLSARRGKQINYMWEFNLDPDKDAELIKKFYKDYEKHMEYCSLFMGDLMEMVASSDKGDSNKIIKHWLLKEEDNENVSIMPLLTQLGTEVLNDSDGEPIYRMTLPSDPVQRRTVEQILKPVKHDRTASQITFMKKDFLDSETLMVPLMRTDFASKTIIFNIKSEKFVVGDSIPEPAMVNNYLSDLEDYIKTVDMGQTRNENISKMTKMSMFEGLIYFFSSPFMNEYMGVKRERVGNIDERGPRFLFISGGSSNGKTTFIKYILHLMTGKEITPVDKSKFSKQYILKAAGIGTTFPLVFDDVPPQRLNSADMETTIKSYWETWWSKDNIFPEIIVSSNARSTKEWYQTRMKTLNFDVHFEPSMKAREILSEIFSRENHIFQAFVNYYFRNSTGELYDDELHTGRKTMLDLYKYTGRAIPEYFPEVPVEELYDPDKVKWQELIDMNKVELVDKVDSLEIIFSDGFTRMDVEHYADSIKHAKHRVIGTTIVVESPEDFRKWLDLDKEVKSGLLSKLFGRKKR